MAAEVIRFNAISRTVVISRRKYEIKLYETVGKISLNRLITHVNQATSRGERETFGTIDGFFSLKK